MRSALTRPVRRLGRTKLGATLIGRGRVEAALCAFLLPDRLRLPTLEVQELFPGLAQPSSGDDGQLLERIVSHLRPERTLTLGADAPPDAPVDLVLVLETGNYSAVRVASDRALGSVSHDGHVIWQGYANRGYLTAAHEVPECLVDIAHHTPIVHVAGSQLAVHSPSWASAAHYASGKMAS